MSKRQQHKKTAKQKSTTVTGELHSLSTDSTMGKLLHFISNKRIQLLLIVIITFAFYSNSINNDFAEDDGQFYSANQFVLKGVSGIYDLFTKESMYGYYAQGSIVSGGRWRPLSLITFAIEKEFFGADPHVSHFINMLLLALTGIIMLLFLRQYIFKLSPIAAFVVVLLFIIHPVHTEAVSHIKSRDELLSWIFLLLTLYCSLNFLTKRNYWQLVLSLVFYFLALLSKENGVTFIAILPLSFYFFSKEKLRTIVFTTLPFAVVLGIYMFMRFSFVTVLANASKDITNAPYLYATPIQHLATALMMLGKYILLLFWPNPLSCDYSYNSVPYVNFSDWRVWLSVLIQAALVIYALLKLKEKSLVSYGILFYFCSIIIVSNIVLDVGTFIGERFLYQPSFGFCIAVVAVLNNVLQKIKLKNAARLFAMVFALIVVIVLLSGYQTRQRNAEWSNSRTLFTADVRKVPNSMVPHENLGVMFLNDGINAQTPAQRIEDFNLSKSEIDTAISIVPKFPITWFNMGYLNYLTGNYNEAINAYINCINADSTFSQGYNGLGTVYYDEKNYGEALAYFKKGVKIDSLDAEFYYNMGLCYDFQGKYDLEAEYLKKALSLSSMQDQRVNYLNTQAVNQHLLDAEMKLQNKK